MPAPHGGLRDRKRERTRRAIVDAAVDLFERNGYDGTTVADIAAAAEIGTRTFFGYFASKEEVLFPEVDERVRTAVEAIAARGPGDRPADVLLRALGTVDAAGDMTSREAVVRMRLIRTVPAVRGRGLAIQLDAQREIAHQLHEAYPGELDEVSAGALVGAFVGAVTGAVQALADRDAAGAGADHDAAGAGAEDVQARREMLRAATDAALRPWRRGP